MKIILITLCMFVCVSSAYSSETIVQQPTLGSTPRLTAPEVIDRISAQIASNHTTSSTKPDRALYSDVKPTNQDRSWVKRHPVGFGALLSFGIGFAIGLAAGDGGFPFDDTDAAGNGVILGGIGAGVGAFIGKIISDY